MTSIGLAAEMVSYSIGDDESDDDGDTDGGDDESDDELVKDSDFFSS